MTHGSLTPDAVDRLVMMMVNEAAWCLGEGVVSSARDGDLGAVLGLGFPPFRAGPFHWVDAVGAAEVSHGTGITGSQALIGLVQASMSVAAWTR